jgi:hypothetical protein
MLYFGGSFPGPGSHNKTIRGKILEDSRKEIKLEDRWGLKIFGVPFM